MADINITDEQYKGVRCTCVLTGCRAGPGCPHYGKHCQAHIDHTQAAMQAQPVQAGPVADSLQVTAGWQAFGRTAAYRQAVQWAQQGEIPGALFTAWRAGLQSQAAVTQPAQPVQAGKVLTDDEALQILFDWFDNRRAGEVQLVRAVEAAVLRRMQQQQVVAWVRDQRGDYEGRETLDPLFLLGSLDPGRGANGATYSPLVGVIAAPVAQDKEGA